MNNNLETQIKDLLKSSIKYSPKNVNIFKKALIHKSIDQKDNYERLEFLGDRVLGLIISTFLYDLNLFHLKIKAGDMHNAFKSYTEESSQTIYFDRLGLNKLVNYSIEELSNKIKTDFFEAFLGAIYYDGGITRARAIMNKIALHDSKKYNSYSFVTKRELQVRNLLKKRHKSKLEIEYHFIKKNWELKTTIKNKSFQIGNKNLVIARKELIEWLFKTFNK